MKIKYSIFALACITSFSIAQDTYTLEKVLVSTTSLGTNQSIDDVQASIEVIDKKSIEKSNARSLPQLLDKSVGLNVKDAGSTSSLSLRGFNSSHTLLLVDGLRRTGKYGSFDLTSIQLEDIERIEIVRGPMSTLYGADAIAGVVNIITRKDKVKEYDKLTFLTGAAENGQRETYVTKFSGSKTFSNITHNYALELREKDSYRHDKNQVSTDLKEESRKFINYSNTFRINDENRLKNSIEYSNQDDKGLNSSNNETYEKEKRYQLSTNYNHTNEDFIFDTNFSYGYSDTDVNRGAGSETTDYKQFELNNYLRHFTTDDMINIIGLGYKNDDIKVSMYTKEASRDNFFFFLQNEYNITDSLTTNIGLRYDDFSDFGDTVNPKLSVMYKYDDFSFRTSYGEAFKAPSFTDMYSHFTRSRGPNIYDISGSEDLKPEESKSYEFALNYNNENFNFDIVHHRTKLENLIASYDVNKVGFTTFVSKKNIDKAIINGTEISMAYDFENGFSVNSTLELLDTKDEATQERLTGSAKTTWKVNIAYEKDSFGANLDFKRLIDYYGTDENRNNVNSDYTVADIKLDYKINKSITIFTGIDNLEDKKMPYNMTSRGTPNDPGERFYYAGLTIKF